MNVYINLVKFVLKGRKLNVYINLSLVKFVLKSVNRVIKCKYYKKNSNVAMFGGKSRKTKRL